MFKLRDESSAQRTSAAHLPACGFQIQIHAVRYKIEFKAKTFFGSLKANGHHPRLLSPLFIFLAIQRTNEISSFGLNPSSRGKSCLNPFPCQIYRRLPERPKVGIINSICQGCVFVRSTTKASSCFKHGGFVISNFSALGCSLLHFGLN